MKVSILTNEGLKTFENLLNSAKVIGKARYLEISEITEVRNKILNSKKLSMELDGIDCGPPEKLPIRKLDAINHIVNILKTCQENPDKNALTDPNYPLQFVTEKTTDEDREDFIRLIFDSISKGEIITVGKFQEWFSGEMSDALVAGFGGMEFFVEIDIESKWDNKTHFMRWVLMKFTR